MDFVDWRNSADEAQINSPKALRPNVGRLNRRILHNYIEEIIQDAQERGEFDNLAGAGEPLKLDDEQHAGDNALAYHLLKSNNSAPAEIELFKEISALRERAARSLVKVIHQGETLRARRVPPFASEKRAFNASVEKTAAEYERTLRELNRKIMVLNLSTPVSMHQPLVNVKQLIEDFRAACPLLEDE
jgi:DnaJ family protein C protein 28